MFRSVEAGWPAGAEEASRDAKIEGEWHSPMWDKVKAIDKLFKPPPPASVPRHRRKAWKEETIASSLSSGESIEALLRAASRMVAAERQASPEKRYPVAKVATC